MGRFLIIQKDVIIVLMSLDFLSEKRYMGCSMRMKQMISVALTSALMASSYAQDATLNPAPVK
jgi:hypothetical protein